MSEFMRPPAGLEAEIAACNSPEMIREIVKRSLAKAGVISRESSGEYGVQYLGQPAPATEVALPAASEPAPRATCVRVIYPGGNDRYEIFGVSEADLDLKEQRIRAAYEQR